MPAALACYVLAVASKEHAILAPLAALPVYVRDRAAATVATGHRRGRAAACWWGSPRSAALVPLRLDPRQAVRRVLARLPRAARGARPGRGAQCVRPEHRERGVALLPLRLRLAAAVERMDVDRSAPAVPAHMDDVPAVARRRWATSPRSPAAHGWCCATATGARSRGLSPAHARAALRHGVHDGVGAGPVRRSTAAISGRSACRASCSSRCTARRRARSSPSGVAAGRAAHAGSPWTGCCRWRAPEVGVDGRDRASSRTIRAPWAAGSPTSIAARHTSTANDFGLALRDFEASSALGDLGHGALQRRLGAVGARAARREALAAFDRAEKEGYSALQPAVPARAGAACAAARRRRRYDQFLASRKLSPPSPTLEAAAALHRPHGAPAQPAAEAVDALQYLVVIEPHNHEARYLLGMAYIMKGERAARARDAGPAASRRSRAAAPTTRARWPTTRCKRKAEALSDIDNAIRMAGRQREPARVERAQDRGDALMRILHVGKYYPPVARRHGALPGRPRRRRSATPATRSSVLVHDTGQAPMPRDDPPWLMRCPVWMRLFFAPHRPALPVLARARDPAPPRPTCCTSTCPTWARSGRCCCRRRAASRGSCTGSRTSSPRVQALAAARVSALQHLRACAARARRGDRRDLAGIPGIEPARSRSGGTNATWCTLGVDPDRLPDVDAASRSRAL